VTATQTPNGNYSHLYYLLPCSIPARECFLTSWISYILAKISFSLLKISRFRILWFVPNRVGLPPFLGSRLLTFRHRRFAPRHFLSERPMSEELSPFKSLLSPFFISTGHWFGFCYPRFFLALDFAQVWKFFSPGGPGLKQFPHRDIIFFLQAVYCMPSSIPSEPPPTTPGCC